jgi:DNA (cytosine-5)-methyltransferase 1
VLTLNVGYNEANGTVTDVLRSRLQEYDVFPGSVNVADYGVPQIRRRALVVAVHKEEKWLGQVPGTDYPACPPPTHAEKPRDGRQRWVSVRQWLESLQYETLDASSKDSARGAHQLHFVPAYGPDRYQQVSQIPAYSGMSAYENDTCLSCDFRHVEQGLALCPACGNLMRNRPYVERNGQPSLIKGFRSSCRRMSPGRAAYTITTNSSHVGSDFKIHPWENRVLSILECADLQTVPRFYDWTRAKENRTLYLIRNLVGEAFPPYFTYIHGLVLEGILSSGESKCQEDTCSGHG